MRLIGAVLAGGRSRRFGSDKGLAVVGERPLVAHAIDALRAQTDQVVLCGRYWPDLPCLADTPTPGLGPLGGLSAALRHARAVAAEAVLCVPLDVYPLPHDLADRLGAGPATLATQWSIGIWPASLSDALDEYLAQGQRSLRGWIARTGARAVCDADLGLANINRPADLPTLAA